MPPTSRTAGNERRSQNNDARGLLTVFKSSRIIVGADFNSKEKVQSWSYTVETRRWFITRKKRLQNNKLKISVKFITMINKRNERNASFFFLKPLAKFEWFIETGKSFSNFTQELSWCIELQRECNLNIHFYARPLLYFVWTPVKNSFTYTVYTDNFNI